MTLALIVYFASTLSKLPFMFAILAALCAGLAIVFTLRRHDVQSYKSLYGDEERTPEKLLALSKNTKRFATLAVTLFCLVFFIPSERTMYVMAGAYAAQQVAENPNVQRLSGKVLTVIEGKLDEIIDDNVKQVEERVNK